MEASKRAGTAYLNMRSNSHEFDLTHKTGSFMYMAPEVFKERKYNEKVGQQHCGTFWAVTQLLMLALGVRLLSWLYLLGRMDCSPVLHLHQACVSLPEPTQIQTVMR